MSLSFALLVLNVCNVFALPKCPIEKKVPYHNCFGTYIFSNGDMYVGEFQNGKKNGQGTYTFATSGNKYVGEYKNDMRSGNGTATYETGDKYVGEFKNNKKTVGTFLFSNGEKHVGEFKSDKYDGYGIHSYPDGNRHVGHYKNNQRSEQVLSLLLVGKDT